MTYLDRTQLFFIASLLAACGPDDPADTDGGSEGEPTSTTTGPTTDEPTTTAPTTTTSTTTEGTTTEGVTTDDEPVEAVACEHLPGPDGGAVDWYLRCGGLQDEYLNAVSTDADGNIYLAIELRVFDVSSPLQIGEVEVTPGELSDILLIKLSSAGAPQWVRHFTGPEDQSVYQLVTCGDGLVLTGWADPGTLDLGGGPVEGDFVAALDFDGQHRWSRSVSLIGEDSHVRFNAATCDEAGTLALTGVLGGSVDFGGGPVEAPELEDAFVVTYDAAGAFQWARQFNSTGDAAAGAASLAFTPAGEVVLAGSFTGSVDLGGGPLMTDFQPDMLVAKFSAAGEHVWSQQFGTSDAQHGTAIAADSTGRVALGGVFFAGIEIGDETYNNVFPEQIPDLHGTLYDGVLALLDPSGAVQSSQHLGTMLDDRIDNLSFDAADALVMAGLSDGAFALRVFDGQAQTWEWSTDQLDERTTSARSGEDAVIVGASPYSADVDLGSGPLVDRGEYDVVVARIRR